MIDKPNAVWLVIEPLSLVHLSVFVNEATVVVWLIVLPVALVQTSIRIDLKTLASTEVATCAPISDVYGAILKRSSLSLFSLF